MKALKKLQKFLPAGAFGMSLLIHLVIFMSISGLILIEAVKPKVPFIAAEGKYDPSDLPPPPDIPDEQLDVPMEAMADNASSDAVQQSFDVEQIVSTAPSTMPMFTIQPTAPSALATGGKPGGTGSGDGKTSGPRGIRAMANPFGGNPNDGGALVGFMYDLKQTPDRKPSDMAGATAKGGDEGKARNLYSQFLSKFIDRNWDEAMLAKYYRVERPLGTYQIFIPHMSADAAPAAFNAEKYVQPRRWVILYKGSFTAPDSGNFRFHGICDDVILVRIGARTVFDGSLGNIASNVKREAIGNCGVGGRPMFVGSWFQMEKGQSYPIQILIGEQPGGEFYAFLTIEKSGEKYEMRSNKKNLLLPVFQLSPTTMPKNYQAESNAPAVAKDPFVCE